MNANKPPLKQPEWDEKGVGNDGKRKKKGKGREKKYCNDCKEVITAKSDPALPKADIGLNITILICCLWVALCLPFTRIQDYLQTFFGKKYRHQGFRGM